MSRSTNTILASVAAALPVFFVKANEMPKGLQILWLGAILGLFLAGLALWACDRR